MDKRMPDVHSIHKGKVVRVATYGCFVEMPGVSKWGFVHVSQLADPSSKGGARIETKNVVDMGDDVWVKVCDVDPEACKIWLSMKYVSQASGRDLDPEQAEYEKNRRSERQDCNLNSLCERSTNPAQEEDEEAESNPCEAAAAAVDEAERVLVALQVEQHQLAERAPLLPELKRLLDAD